MYNEYDDEFEVHDLDDNIQRKEAILAEIKAIDPQRSWNEVFSTISALRRKWKQVPNGESAYEDELLDAFESYLNTFYAKRNEGYQNNETMKKELIAQAKKVAQSKDWNVANDEMEELMNQWKATGSAGKEVDDALWELFRLERQVFFDRKRANWEDMQSKFENATKVKEELIAKAAALSDCEDFQKTSEMYRELMNEWKAAGSAGKQNEDTLWKLFQTHRQKFYDRRNAYYEEQHTTQEGRYEQKQSLIREAKEIADKKTYDKEDTALMKALNVKWKTIGSCARDKEDEVWLQFRSIMDAYFAGIKEKQDQKHAQWRKKMMDARTRKQELIQSQKRQIKYLENEMVGLLGERAIQETEDEIAEKKAFIIELEEQLADIEKTLHQG